MYWMIENAGEAPVECLTLLGLSTSRGLDEKIGQFGTGCKHAVNVLLRAGITTVIYSGEKRIEFFAQPKKVEGSNKVYSLICYTMDGETYETSMTLDFGEIDWQDIHMAVREFISNAIDAGEPNFNKVSRIEYESGKTRVFFQETPEINKYFVNIGKHFLHFSNRKDKDQKIMEKESNGPALIYRKGVLVREIGFGKKKMDSMFDYNLNDMQIDECRNMNDFSATNALSKAIGNDQKVVDAILKRMVHEQDFNFFEAEEIDEWGIRYGRVDLKTTWERLFGDKVICSPKLLTLIPEGADLSQIVLISSDVWYKALAHAKIRTIKDLMPEAVSPDGHAIVPLCPETEEAFNLVWNWLWMSKSTNEKKKPRVVNFKQSPTKEGEIHKDIKAAYSDNVVYVNIDFAESKSGIFECLIQYISGAIPCSRAHLDYTNSVIAKFIDS